MGDSISTYPNCNPHGAPVYYREDKLYDSGLQSASDTWWMQVIDELGEFCANNSFSGSLVSGEAFVSACSDRRCYNLHLHGMPDLILIYMGMNDCGHERTVGRDRPDDQNTFYGAYRIMLQKIKRNYPAAKIVCATLPAWRDLTGKPAEQFKEWSADYNEAIRAAAREEGCLLADLAACGEYYEAFDGCHPNKNGHRQLAALWLKALKAIL